MKLMLLFLINFKPIYFQAIYNLEKLPVDSALHIVYKELKATPDSELADMAISLTAKRISSYDFSKFVKEMNNIQRAIPYLDSIFSIYAFNYAVYDSLLNNYLKISLFMKKNRNIDNILLSLYHRYRGNASLLPVLLHFASRFKAYKAMKEILPEVDNSIDRFDSPVLITLLRNAYNKKDFKRMGEIIKILDKRSLNTPDMQELLKLKGLYFEAINKVDSALFYLTSYIQNTQTMDMFVSRHLLSLYIKNNMYQDAKKTALTLLSLSPFDVSLRKQLAYIYFMQENYDSSLINYLLAKSLSKNDADIHYYIARVLTRKNLFKDALSSINRAIKIENRYSYNLLKAFILMKLGYYDEAGRVLLVWKNRGQYDPYYYYLTGIILKGMGRDHLAYKYLLKSVAIDSTKPLRYLPLLSLSSKFNDTLILRSSVAKIRKLKLKDKEDIFDLAYAAQILGDVKLADSLYRELISMDPQNPLYFNNLGYLWLTHGNIENARKYLEKAFKMSPEDPYIIDSYAWLLFKQGKLKKAYELSRKAVKLGGKDPEIKKHFKAIEQEYEEKR